MNTNDLIIQTLAKVKIEGPQEKSNNLEKTNENMIKTLLMFMRWFEQSI